MKWILGGTQNGEINNHNQILTHLKIIISIVCTLCNNDNLLYNSCWNKLNWAVAELPCMVEKSVQSRRSCAVVVRSNEVLQEGVKGRKRKGKQWIIQRNAKDYQNNAVHKFLKNKRSTINTYQNRKKWERNSQCKWRRSLCCASNPTVHVQCKLT